MRYVVLIGCMLCLGLPLGACGHSVVGSATDNGLRSTESCFSSEWVASDFAKVLPPGIGGGRDHSNGQENPSSREGRDSLGWHKNPLVEEIIRKAELLEDLKPECEEINVKGNQ